VAKNKIWCVFSIRQEGLASQVLVSNRYI